MLENSPENSPFPFERLHFRSCFLSSSRFSWVLSVLALQIISPHHHASHIA